MKIAVASGKGGTGKTTVAVNLVLAAAEAGERAAYIDCDVEEPNGHIFLKPEIATEKVVELSCPEVDMGKCSSCGECSRVCQLNAIKIMGTEPLVFPQMCSGCGGCYLICPESAIVEINRRIGTASSGRSGNVGFAHGSLDIGEPRAVPVIAGVKELAGDNGLAVFDAPPGTSCPVIESVSGSDFILLVTEPTPFGLHDLKLAIDMAKALKIPFEVVVNRAGAGDDRVAEYCQEAGIGIIAEVPYDREIAKVYSRGANIFEALPEYRDLFTGLYRDLKTRIGGQK